MFGFLVKKKGKGDKRSRPGNFYVHAGEFILAFLGVLIALQVENWNQDRQERKPERVLLSEMLVNLQVDPKDVEANIQTHQSSMNSYQTIIDYVDGHIPYHDSLESHFAKLHPGTVFNENTSAFESLKSIGIDLISSAGRAVPLDTFEIRNSNRFRHAVYFNIILTEYQLRSYQIAKNGIIQLISQIENELS